MINISNFNEELQKIIYDKQNEPEIDISSIQAYTKPEIDAFYEYAKDKCLECITDDYYSQEYIDSFCKNIKTILNKMNIDMDMYTKIYIDSLLQSFKLLANLKQDKDDNLATMDDIYTLIGNINIDGIDSYTIEQFENLLSNILTVNSIEIEIMSTNQGNTLYERYKECEKLYRLHLDNICDALSTKGVYTPKGTSVQDICINIYKLVTGGSMVHPDYNIYKLIDTSNVMYVMSDNTAHIYVAYEDRIDRYLFDGTLDLSLTKTKNGTTIYMYQVTESNTIQIVDKKSCRHIIFLSGDPIYITSNDIYNDISVCCTAYRVYEDPDYDVLYSLNDDGENRISTNILNLNNAGSGAVTSLIVKAANSDFTFDENYKLTSTGYAIFIYKDNKLYYCTNYIGTSTNITEVNTINKIILAAKDALLCSDKGLFEYKLFTNTLTNINGVTDNVTDVYVENNDNLFAISNDKMVYIDRKNDKTFNFDVGEEVKYIYKDCINRFIIWGENSIYVATKKE